MFTYFKIKVFLPAIILFFLVFPTGSTLAQTTTENIWGTQTPASTVSDSVRHELGTIFSPNVDGLITGVRVYAVKGESGNHTVRIWNNVTNTVIKGPYTFSASGTGWRTYNFSSPLSITAGTSYTVSITTGGDSARRYAIRKNVLTTAGSNGQHLNYPANAGVFTTNLGTRPTQTYLSSNYYRDVIFSPTVIPTPPPSSGPDGPILIITSSNLFTGYLAEIIQAEGFNEYKTEPINNITATILNNYDVVILGETFLSDEQVSLLTTWVNNGGNLIAMKPDKKLTSLLSLTDAGTTLSDGYIQVDTSSQPGAGIVSDTIQYHSTADRYTLNGATSIANLYSDSTTSTNNPAVVIQSVGANGGQAAAFTYDLAKSIIYTRQGNPVWAGQERDGESNIRPNDLFYPDYVNLNKVQIPQADEQQRLLANMILYMNDDKKPMPRFWYLPRGLKAAIIHAVDDHNTTNGTKATYDKLNNNSTANCSVDDWECLRATSWVYTGISLTNTEVAAYTAQGHEFGIHVDTGCTNFSSASQLNTFYDNQISTFVAKWPSAPTQTTHRVHCIIWSDWLTQAKVEAGHGMRLSLDYYYWPPAWVNGRPGLFTGSGIPMRYADTDGSILDVYQAPSQLVNENGINYTINFNTLLDNAIGSKGFYGMFGTHDDWRDTTFSNVMINAANSRNIPIITAKQALDWVDGRGASSFESIEWNFGNKTLSFSINQHSKARNLRAMLPMVNAGVNLNGITRNGSAVTFTQETIKGISYAFFPGTTGSYVATYDTATTPTPTSTTTPTPSNDPTPTSTPTNTPTVTPTPTQSTTYTLWSGSTTPAITSDLDTGAVEVGVKFRSNVDGQILGVRFYKGSGNTGTHTGKLWSNAGTQLASVTFTDETSTGWQQALFSTPVNIQANTTYVVSYFAPNGRYAVDENYFISDYINSPLSALSTGGSGGNGVYRYGSSSFPTYTYQASNYWVDVVFRP